MKVLALLMCGVGLAIPLGVAQAAPPGHDGSRQHSFHSSQRVSWQRRDTATYVVSTLNLLRTDRGQSVTTVVENRLDVSRYAVFADGTTQGLYFIQLKRDTGTVVGALAYRMGWPRPLSLTPSLQALGVPPAPDDVLRAYHSGHLVFLSAFPSSLPR